MKPEENGRVLTFAAGPEDEGRRVRDILKKQWGLVHHDIARAKYSEGGITVDGKSVYASHEMKAGEILRVFIPEKKSGTTVPTQGRIDILYEDDDLIAVSKPAGLVVHPSHGHYTDSLANMIAWHYEQEGEMHEIRTVGRLDKDTSGIIVYAKNRTAVSKLTDQAEEGRRTKIYLALAEGVFDTADGTIDAPIGRVQERADGGEASGHESTKRCVRPDGDPAVTHFHVERQFPEYALLSVTIDTGRTHQIRVHLAHIGHPLLGDELYGHGRTGTMRRAALHAWKTEMDQPFTGERIVLEAPLPEDMRRMAAFLEEQAGISETGCCGAAEADLQ